METPKYVNYYGKELMRMYKIKLYNEQDSDTNKLINKYMSIMNIYNKGVIFFDIYNKIAYLNKNCSELFDVKNSLCKIENFIDKIQFDEAEDGINKKDIDCVTYSLKYIKEDRKIKYIICLIEKKVDDFQWCNNEKLITVNNIIGESEKIKLIKNKIQKVAGFDSTVLLVGETGVGKELFAKAIHGNSNRRKERFIVINCGAIPDSLVESELFGYEKGSFTGANSNGKIGKFEAANRGTIFLDEVENMSAFMQNKILRFLEDHKISRVGSTREIEVDVRIVAATNKNLKDMVDENIFRKDLYYRLNVVKLDIPNLREREDDIFRISEHFIKEFSAKFHKPVEGISEEVKNIMRNHLWKGNVRELRNIIEYAMNFEDSNYITKESLPEEIIKEIDREREKIYIRPLEEMEREVIEKALNYFGWDEAGKLKAAKALGISRSSIYRKVTKYDLSEKMKYLG